MVCNLPTLTKERIVQPSNYRHSDYAPSRPRNRRVLKAIAYIPQQMPQPIQTVVEEGEGKEGLEPRLGSQWPRRDSCNHGCGLEMPARVRSGEIREAKEVERPAQGDSGEAVEG